jgi:hypothetical protein
MTQNEVINKLAMEEAVLLGDLDNLNTFRWFIRQALVIGIDHFSKDMEEIIQLTHFGEEVGRYKSLREAARETGIDRRNIHHVLVGQSHSAGGFLFIKANDKELIPVKKTA